MAYSSRQMYGLKTMGLVAWSNGRAQEVGDIVPTTTISLNDIPATDTANDPAPITTSEKLATAQPLHWFEQLAVQTLDTFSYRGMMVDCIGVDTAPLMVVCNADVTTREAAPSAGDQPMSGECMQLFDLMMRSIGVAKNNIRLCAASHQASTASARNVTSLLTPQTKAVLLLEGSMATSGAITKAASESIEQNADSARLPPSQLPVWRIPHPELLLSTPNLKRQAWQNLKALKQVIVLQENA